jgi:hypothetical protein
LSQTSFHINKYIIKKFLICILINTDYLVTIVSIFVVVVVVVIVVVVAVVTRKIGKQVIVVIVVVIISSIAWENKKGETNRMQKRNDSLYCYIPPRPRPLPRPRPRPPLQKPDVQFEKQNDG